MISESVDAVRVIIEAAQGVAGDGADEVFDRRGPGNGAGGGIGHLSGFKEIRSAWMLRSTLADVMHYLMQLEDIPTGDPGIIAERLDQ